jgi:hypothetical protein
VGCGVWGVWCGVWGVGFKHTDLTTELFCDETPNPETSRTYNPAYPAYPEPRTPKPEGHTSIVLDASATALLLLPPLFRFRFQGLVFSVKG